ADYENLYRYGVDVGLVGHFVLQTVVVGSGIGLDEGDDLGGRSVPSCIVRRRLRLVNEHVGDRQQTEVLWRDHLATLVVAVVEGDRGAHALAVTDDEGVMGGYGNCHVSASSGLEVHDVGGGLP